MKRRFSAERKVNYTFPVDGLVRRQLHEFGAKNIDFYEEVLDKMGFQEDDVVLDIGAGNGFDALTIAKKYHPQRIYALEPLGQSHDEFEDKFNILRFMMQEEGIKSIEPLAGVAENIPLTDNSVSKLMMIHSAYHFDDLKQALSEARRVLIPNGLGMLVTNGKGDKVRFRKLLRQMGEPLHNKSPDTVSSRLNYDAAAARLAPYFEVFRRYIYRDDMIITRENLPIYLWAFDSYRHLFEHPVINDGRWRRVRQGMVETPIEKEMAANDGIFRDTIDIAAIYFRNSKKASKQRILGRYSLL